MAFPQDKMMSFEQLYKQLEALPELVNSQWMLTGCYKDSEKVSAEPFEAIEINLMSLWRTTAWLQ